MPEISASTTGSVHRDARTAPADARRAAPSAPDRSRRRGVQTVLEVVGVERLSPHLVRIHLGGENFDAFLAGADPEKLAKTDKYVKMLFAKPELGLVPPYDLDALREKLAPEDVPVRRTYTIRSIDTARRSLAIDFVVHGDEGLAGPWAAAAQVGDLVSFSGPGAMFAPTQDDVTHLFVGDDSSIPAIDAALEALAPDARGLALIEVGEAADEIPLAAPAGVDVRWLHRRAADGDAPYGQPLVAAVEALPVPAGAVEVFAHGEREAMKQLRRIFQTEWGLDRRDMSLSAYWAYGRTEDRFQSEKREPVGQIFED